MYAVVLGSTAVACNSGSLCMRIRNTLLLERLKDSPTRQEEAYIGDLIF